MKNETKNEMKNEMAMTKFSGLIKKRIANQVAAEKEIAELFGSVPPSRYESAHMTIVLDQSMSMRGEKSEQLKTAFRELERQFPEVSNIILAFNHTISRLESLDEYHPHGPTALRDSIMAAIQITAAETNHNNIIIPIICDGEDNMSRISVKEVAQAVAEKKQQGWQFYIIFIGNEVNFSRFRERSAVYKIPSMKESEIPKAVSRLAAGIYGYLETGRLMLT